MYDPGNTKIPVITSTITVLPNEVDKSLPTHSQCLVENPSQNQISSLNSSQYKRDADIQKKPITYQTSTKDDILLLKGEIRRLQQKASRLKEKIKITREIVKARATKGKIPKEVDIQLQAHLDELSTSDSDSDFEGGSPLEEIRSCVKIASSSTEWKPFCRIVTEKERKILNYLGIHVTDGNKGVTWLIDDKHEKGDKIIKDQREDQSCKAIRSMSSIKTEAEPEKSEQTDKESDNDALIWFTPAERTDIDIAYVDASNKKKHSVTETYKILTNVKCEEMDEFTENHSDRQQLLEIDYNDQTNVVVKSEPSSADRCM